MKNSKESFSNQADFELHSAHSSEQETTEQNNVSSNEDEQKNKAKIEKEISDDYLTNLNFQMEIEEEIVENFSKTQNSNLRESLLSLRKSGEESLKNISAKVVSIFNSNKLVVKLRDIYVEKRSEKIYKELSVQNKLAKAEDYDGFLKLVQSDFWGSSSSAGDATFRVNSALASIMNRFPEKTNEILEIWPKLFSREAYRNYNLFIKSVADIKAKEYLVLENDEKKKEYIRTSNDFVAIDCLSSRSDSINYYNFEGDEIFNHLDSIISKYPNTKELPEYFTMLIFRACSSRPEEIMSNSQRTNFLFNLWVGKFVYSGEIFNTIPIFADRIKNCSEEETDKILNILLKNLNSNNYNNNVSRNFGCLIDLLPLNSSQIKLINKQKNISDDILSRNKDRLLEKNTAEKEYEFLLANAGSSGGDRDNVVFLSNLIANYPNKLLGIEENELGAILDALSERQNENLGIDTLHGLAELMNRHHWSDNLQKKVFKLNNIGGWALKKIIAESDDKSFDWMRNNPPLVEQLQLDFHKKAKANDLRHYFYEVLDGKKKTDNFDDLVKSYGDTGDFSFDDVKSLFINNRIDRKYIQYFIGKIDVMYILNSLNDIGANDYSWFLESAIKYGKADYAVSVLKQFISIGNITDPEKRLELIDNLINNVLIKVDTPIGPYDSTTSNISRQIFDKNSTDFLAPEETYYLGRKIMDGALNFENNGKVVLLILSEPNKINDFFSDDGEKKEYLMKLFDKLVGDTNNYQYFALMSAYFKNPELFEVLDNDYRVNLENKIFNLNITNRGSDLLLLSNNMDNNQKNRFLECFVKNYTVAKAHDYMNLCGILADADYFFSNKEIYTRIYIQILNDPDLKSDAASRLFRENIIFSDDEIKNAFFFNLERWPGIDGTKILEFAAGSQKNPVGENDKINFSLSYEEVKKISSTVMHNRGLSPKFWKGYLSSDDKNPSFYLDEDIFRAGIANIGKDCFKEKGSDIVVFIESLSKSNFKFDDQDVKMIINKAIEYSMDVERFEAFHKYYPVITENIIAEKEYYQKALEANISYSPEFNKKIFDYVLDSSFPPTKIESFLIYLKKNNNLEMIAQTKKKLLKLDNNLRTIGQLSLLKYDLLDVKESRKLYEESTSSSSNNARVQILNSINIIGSMLSNRNNIGQLENFLDNPRTEDVENLKNIAEFIEEYSKENKGRSIAVMLFAREYLPDRSLEDVIERVASSLRKYGEIINNNSYKNIPSGFRASIGMEYEITSSTAKGYESLTSQPSLRSDIASVSQAARIGSGNDAVHEIATKPTDNPYLMLLEMKLLHDIEYVDLNFDRSEDYQKGARGFHLTIGGEKGLTANQETNFLQNAIIAASWGGVQSGETGHRANGGRGVSLRNRRADQNHNVNFFGNKSDSVELRSLSIDKQETLQRAITTAFNGSIAIQAFEECFPEGSIEVLNLLNSENGKQRIDETLNSKDKEVADLARLWIKLIEQVNTSIERHNKSFIDEEMFGYLDDKGVWVDASDFGGEYNRKRFSLIIENIDPTLSLEEYVMTTEINQRELFNEFNVQLSDKLTKINNLYLKPGTTSLDNDKNRSSVFKGDNTNAISMLKTTKLGNSDFEYYDSSFLEKTVFDTAGEKRSGYYYLQGASELMLTHAIQRALIDFNSKIEKMVN